MYVFKRLRNNVIIGIRQMFLRKTYGKEIQSLQVRLNSLQVANRQLRQELKESQYKAQLIKESEERFRLLVESSPNAILLTDEFSHIKMINHQTELLFGYDRGELMGNSIDILIPEQYRKKHSVFVQKYAYEPAARKMGHGRDLTALTKNGKEIPVEIGLTPLYSKGQLLILVTIIDLIERKKIEQSLIRKNEELIRSGEEIEKRTLQLIQSEKMNALGTLIAGVAHELNNPLTGILHYSQYLQNNHVSGSKYREIISDIVHETRRCVEIVRDLLQYSYPHPTEKKTSVTRELLEGMIRNIYNLFALQGRDIIFDMQIDKPIKDFQFDINKLHQVITNLVKNSIDAVELCNRKNVIVKAYSDNLHLHLLVEDSGTGIDEKTMARIFDPFYTTKEVGKGTGLGLTLTKKIIEDNNGEIHVNSKPGEGTKFHIKFALIEKDIKLNQYEQQTTRH